MSQTTVTFIETPIAIDRPTAHVRSILRTKLVDLAMRLGDMDRDDLGELSALLYLGDTYPWAWGTGEHDIAIRESLESGRDLGVKLATSELLEALTGRLDALCDATEAGRRTVDEALHTCARTLNVLEPELRPEVEADLPALDAAVSRP